MIQIDAEAIVDAVRRAQVRYSAMVVGLRAGRRMTAEAIAETLRSAGRSDADLVNDIFVAQGPAQPGDPCPACSGGHLVVRNSKRNGDSVTQYLACASCGHRPPRNKRRLPADTIRSRRRV
jgi:hypothetical protein